MTTAKDYTGQKFGHLTFIRQTNVRKWKKIIWELQCDCGNLYYNTPYKVTSGSVQGCGCRMWTAYTGEGGKKARKFHPIISSARKMWRDRYRECKFETFYEMSQQPCHYCGSPPSLSYNKGFDRGGRHVSDYQKDSGTFIYNGLDRKNSDLPHIEGNIVPCCWRCNRMKSNTPYNDFLQHIRTMYVHWACHSSDIDEPQL